MSVSTPASHTPAASENCSPVVDVDEPEGDHQHPRTAVRAPQRHVGADGDEAPRQRDAEVADAAAAGRQSLRIAREAEHHRTEREGGDPGEKEGGPHFERLSLRAISGIRSPDMVG